MSMKIEDFIEAMRNELPAIEPAELTPQAKFRTLGGWDSLAGLMLQSMISFEYETELEPAELRRCETVQEVFDLVCEKRGHG